MLVLIQQGHVTSRLHLAALERERHGYIPQCIFLLLQNDSY